MDDKVEVSHLLNRWRTKDALNSRKYFFLLFNWCCNENPKNPIKIAGLLKMHVHNGKVLARKKNKKSEVLIYAEFGILFVLVIIMNSKESFCQRKL